MSHLTAPLTDAASLEGAVGARPATHHLKSISDLDPHCEAILALAPTAVVGAVAGDGTLRTGIAGGGAGTLAVDGSTSLELPGAGALDVPDGTPAGILALVPGWGETLRVNGRLRTGDVPSLDVEEAFLHCAKATIRSRLWQGDEPAAGRAGDDPLDLVARSPFVVLSSVDGRGEADVSPKGDPVGFVQVLDERTFAVPDRPGNRRTDTMHNLLERDGVGLLVLVPGDDRVVEARGRARLSADPDLLALMEVKGRPPKAAVVVEADHVEVRAEPLLGAARLWDPSTHVDRDALPRATRIWVDHVKRNDDPGVAAKAARKLANEKVLAKGIDHDYRTNLY